MAPTKSESLLDLVGRHLRLLDPPVAPEIADDALRALGLFEFVHLRFPSPVASHRGLLVEFISSFDPRDKKSFFRGSVVRVDKRAFRRALEVPVRTLSRPPPNVAPEALASAAAKFMETYILPAHRRTGGGFSGPIDRAMREVEKNLAYRVDWLTLIWELAKKEISDMVSDKMYISWDCFYGPYWLRLIWVQMPSLYPVDVVLRPSVRGAATDVPVERDQNLVTQPEILESSGQMSTPPMASVVDEYRKTGIIDSREPEDGENGDVPGLSDGDVNVDSNPPLLFGGIRTRSAAIPQAGSAGEAMMNSTSKYNDIDTKTPARNSRSLESPRSKKHRILSFSDTSYAQEEETGCLIENNEPSSFSENIHPEDSLMAPNDSSSGEENCDTCSQHHELDGIQKSVERTDKPNSYTMDTCTIASGNLKRKAVDRSCGEIITKERGFTSKVTNPRESGSSSLEHMEVQKDLSKEALGTSPVEKAPDRLKKPQTSSEGWDTTKSITHMYKMKQNIEEIVQQYMEKVATVFDSGTLPAAPKKLDRTPGAPLQLPESACYRKKFAFRQIICALKNLQTLASVEQFNQQSFIEEVTMTLDGWDNFFSSHFTKEIKQMVTKLKVLKKELDNESGQQPQSMMEELFDRMKRVGEMVEEAAMVRERITQSSTVIEEMKLAAYESQELLSALRSAHTNNIQELEIKLAAEKESLRLVQSLEAKNADFFAEEMAVSQAISESSSSFEKVTAKGNALSMEIAKRRLQIEEDGGLPAPLQALRSLIVHYPLKE